MTLKILAQGMYPVNPASLLMPPDQPCSGTPDPAASGFIDGDASSERPYARFHDVLRFVEEPEKALQRKAGIETVGGRMEWLRQRPQRQLSTLANDIAYQDLVYEGLPPGYELIVPVQQLCLMHYTSIASAERMLQERALQAGPTPYVRALIAGAERLYMKYHDLVGIFFVDRILNEGELGFIGASASNALLQATIPAGMPVLKLPSRRANIPFYLLPLPEGGRITLDIKAVEQTASGNQ